MQRVSAACWHITNTLKRREVNAKGAKGNAETQRKQRRREIDAKGAKGTKDAKVNRKDTEEAEAQRARRKILCFPWCFCVLCVSFNSCSL